MPCLPPLIEAVVFVRLALGAGEGFEVADVVRFLLLAAEGDCFSPEPDPVAGGAWGWGCLRRGELDDAAVFFFEVLDDRVCGVDAELLGLDVESLGGVAFLLGVEEEVMAPSAPPSTTMLAAVYRAWERSLLDGVGDDKRTDSVAWHLPHRQRCKAAGAQSVCCTSGSRSC